MCRLFILDNENTLHFETSWGYAGISLLKISLLLSVWTTAENCFFADDDDAVDVRLLFFLGLRGDERLFPELLFEGNLDDVTEMLSSDEEDLRRSWVVDPPRSANSTSIEVDDAPTHGVRFCEPISSLSESGISGSSSRMLRRDVGGSRTLFCRLQQQVNGQKLEDLEFDLFITSARCKV